MRAHRDFARLHLLVPKVIDCISWSLLSGCTATGTDLQPSLPGQRAKYPTQSEYRVKGSASKANMPPGSSVLSKLLRPSLVAGVGACGGAIIYYFGFRQEEKKQVFASWTTNYKPSTKWDPNWDHRQPASLVKPAKEDEADQNRFNEAVEQRKSRAVRHLLLIRHGQYETGPKTDELHILTPLGREQAALTGLRLKELSLPYSLITHSTMTRATETSRLIEASLPGVPVRSCPLLEEGAPVPPEPPVGHWRPEQHFYQDGPRIEAAFRKLFHRASPDQEKDSYEVVVCHANVIRYLVCRALQFPAEGWLRMSLNHASVTWVSVMPSGRVALRCLGDSGHMPPDKITSS